MREPWLLVGGVLSLLASLLHIGCIVGGPDWYRFFGAGEAFAQADARGEWWPALSTFGIAVVLAIWAAYAFSGAGVIRPLPLTKAALVAITVIYLARGLFIFSPEAFRRPDLGLSFMFWSSLIVLVYGLVHAVGTWRAWSQLPKGLFS